MKASPQGRALIESREGVMLSAFRDSAGILTITVGHTSAAGVLKGSLTLSKQSYQFSGRANNCTVYSHTAAIQHRRVNRVRSWQSAYL